MQTKLATDPAATPGNGAAGEIIRRCVHCGFCLATCPTYLLLGDELDSPRGRIYQIKEMLETGGAPTAKTVKHVDRCLSCLACVSTCPSGVDYMHLVDHARIHIENHYTRPLPDRLMRNFLAYVLPRPRVFRRLLRLSPFGRPLRKLLPQRLRAMVDMAPRRLAGGEPGQRRQVFEAQGKRRGRVALLAGCAQSVIAPGINAAAIRLLNRAGVEVVVAEKAECCGALPYHLGKVDKARALASAAIGAWMQLARDGEFDAIVVTASGCGTTIRDYAHLFGSDADMADQAATVAGLARDVTEVIRDFEGLPPVEHDSGLVVAYQSACSLQHGQRIVTLPPDLLRRAGFTVVEPKEAHICCGSAGTYNLLQPEIAAQLRERKVAALEATGAGVIATGNIGCLTHLAAATSVPVVHTVELLDWATGGPRPAALLDSGAPSNDNS